MWSSHNAGYQWLPYLIIVVKQLFEAKMKNRWMTLEVLFFVYQMCGLSSCGSLSDLFKPIFCMNITFEISLLFSIKNFTPKTRDSLYPLGLKSIKKLKNHLLCCCKSVVLSYKMYLRDYCCLIMVLWMLVEELAKG